MCSLFSVEAAAPPAEKTAEVLVAELIDCLEVGLTQAQRAVDEAGDDEGAARAAMAEQAATRQALQNVRVLPMLMTAGNLDEVQGHLLRIQVSTASECSAFLQEINTALTTQKAAEAAAFESEIEAWKSMLGEQLLAAKEASELDALFVGLEEVKARSMNLGRRSNHANALSNLSRILSSWQEYLAYRNAGDARRALNALNTITNAVTQAPVVPRSAILERRLQLEGLSAQAGASSEPEAPMTVEALLSQPFTVAELPQLREKLRELSNFSTTRSDAVSALRTVEELQAAVTLIEEGSPLLSFSYLNKIQNSYNRSRWVGTYKEAIAAMALRASIPEEFRPEMPGDTTTSIILPAAEKMAAAGEWLVLWQMFKVVDAFYDRGASKFIPSLQNDVRAIEAYLRAQSLEESGQLSDALVAYNSVLSFTGIYGPREAAKKAIRAIREDRAEALLADQKKEAEEPPVESYAARRAGRLDMRDRETQEFLKRFVDEAAEAKIRTVLAAERVAASKAEAGEGEAEDAED